MQTDLCIREEKIKFDAFGLNKMKMNILDLFFLTKYLVSPCSLQPKPLKAGRRFDLFTPC